MMIELDHIYNCDCLQGMQDIPDGSVDAIICDLPYEVLHKNNELVQWDRQIPLEPLWSKNRRKYHRIVKAMSENRKGLMRMEKMRVNWGIDRKTNLRIPYDPYGRKRSTFKNTCKAVGYIPGSPFNENERWVIFYTNDTKRGELRERNGQKLGFRFEPLPMSSND